MISFGVNMLFEREQDVLEWYEKEERILNPAFLETIPWNDVSRYELHPSFIPVMLYMRDIERFTSMYFEELQRTPTGEDPVVIRFMERWATEETLHGELLNRFLNEAGHATSDRWFEEAKSKLPSNRKYGLMAQDALARLTGKHFSAVHMVFGAINELSTLNGYRRLWESAKHPVLEYLLRAIAREEARHQFFYWNIARLKLEHSRFRQSLSRFLIEKFWRPVGESEKSISESNYVMTTLFKGMEGIRLFNEGVTRRIAELPGFTGLQTLTDRLIKITDMEARSIRL